MALARRDDIAGVIPCGKCHGYGCLYIPVVVGYIDLGNHLDWEPDFMAAPAGRDRGLTMEKRGGGLGKLMWRGW